MYIGRSALDEAALQGAGEFGTLLRDFGASLNGPEALVWFRCCSAFGASGRSFAVAAAERLRCRVAGHTHIIGFFQSGTHSLRPGERPTWAEAEGVHFQAISEGGANTTRRALGALKSSPFRPNTITCLQPDLPDGI
jgi:hypothetical protein